MTQECAEATVRMKFKSGPMAVRAALSHVLNELQEAGADTEDLGTVEIALAEAMNNIVEHAYPEGTEPGPIDVDCRATNGVLHVRIVDDGLPMPGGALPEGKQANLDTDLLDLPEGGFGWFLIQELALSVDYARISDQNVLNMQLTLQTRQ